jgi:hypothetical protein
MSGIPDYSDSDLWIITSTLEERYGNRPEINLAETEMRLDRAKTELVDCPTAYWEAGDCHSIVVKSGDHRYCCRFICRVRQPYGTGIEVCDDRTECVVTPLPVQADHQSREHACVAPG